MNYQVDDAVVMKTATSPTVRPRTTGKIKGVVDDSDEWIYVAWEGFTTFGDPFDGEGWFMHKDEIEKIGYVE